MYKNPLANGEGDHLPVPGVHQDDPDLTATEAPLSSPFGSVAATPQPTQPPPPDPAAVAAAASAAAPSTAPQLPIATPYVVTQSPQAAIDASVVAAIGAHQ